MRQLSSTPLMLLWFTMVGLAAACAAQPPISSDISAEEIAAHVTVLAHDSLRGRRAPSPELDAAARYVAEQLGRMKLEPLVPGYISTFRHELRRLDPSGVRLDIDRHDAPFEYGKDFIALYGSRQQGEGELVVLSASQLSVVDAPTQVSGRMLLAVMPEGSHGPARAAALRLARAAGAAGLILGHTEEVGSELASRRGRYEGALRFDDTGDLIPHLYAGPALTRALRDAAGAAPVTLSLVVPWEVLDPGVIPNVAGFLRGTDSSLSHERVVLVAHLDHLGVRQSDNATSDSIYNGADDNASGVAALLEVAEALAHDTIDLRRTVVFLFTGGEESGLIGSERFVAAEDFIANSVIAVLNLDMVGRNDPGQIRLIGAELSSLGSLVVSLLEERPAIGLRAVVEPDADLFRRSDHYAFAALGIPSLWLFSGFHDDYHEPGDEAERLDMRKVARVANLTLAITSVLARDEPRPALNESGRSLIHGQ